MPPGDIGFTAFGRFAEYRNADIGTDQRADGTACTLPVWIIQFRGMETFRVENTVVKADDVLGTNLNAEITALTTFLSNGDRASDHSTSFR